MRRSATPKPSFSLIPGLILKSISLAHNCKTSFVQCLPNEIWSSISSPLKTCFQDKCRHEPKQTDSQGFTFAAKSAVPIATSYMSPPALPHVPQTTSPSHNCMENIHLSWLLGAKQKKQGISFAWQSFLVEKNPIVQFDWKGTYTPEN